MGRVRTKTTKRASRVLIEKYYPRLTLDFHTNKRIIDEVAVVPSKRLRNKISGFTTHLMKRIQRGPVRGISFKLQEEERERKDNYVPEVSALDTSATGLEVDPDTKELLAALNFESIPVNVIQLPSAQQERAPRRERRTVPGAAGPASSMSFPSTKGGACRLRRTFTTSRRQNDHYKTLGLPSQASKAQIKSHYYQLSKIHHPDISSDPKSRDIFSTLSEAYSILINDRDRRAYDRILQHQQQRQQRQASTHESYVNHHWPPSKGPRATYAWEYAHRPRSAYNAYTYTHPMHPHRQGGEQQQRQQEQQRQWQSKPPPLEPFPKMSRAGRRAEEAAEEFDRVRRVSGVKRALQVIGLMALSFALLGGGGWRAV
ncbi:hypothetical protein AX17_001884 [Amanita inopinata Kibby_2008]|nr:hypothetical protein AX17_001884 [Amanita inopinata Kibby_2008]